MATRTLLGTALSTLAVMMVAACSLSVSLEGLSGSPPDAGAPPSDASVDTMPTGCVHSSYPPPPESATEGGAVNFTVALRSVDFGETGEKPIGLDLDKTCTCQGEGLSCTLPPWVQGKSCDSSEGRDNSIATVFKTIADIAGDGSALGSVTLSERAEKGWWSLLIRVSEYNGEPNDNEVTTALYPTAWEKAGQGLQPLWDGNDVWRVSSYALDDGVSPTKPKYVDQKAYVTDNILVASVPEAYLTMSSDTGDVNLRIVAGTLLGRIEKGSTGYKLTNATVGGRWRMEDIFNIASSIRINNTPLCNDGGINYELFKQLTCSNIDIATSLGGASTVCDAISFGMDFESEPVLLGQVYTPPSLPPNCPPEQDPANDTCAE